MKGAASIDLTCIDSYYDGLLASWMLSDAAQKVAMSESREQFTEHSFEAPRGEFEQSVAHIIAAVLDIDRVGRTDSFYDFGGTSLQAIRICARVESELGCRAQPVWLFTSDVVVDFADRVKAGQVMAAGANE